MAFQKNQLQELYIDKGLSAIKIGKMFGRNEATIRYHLKKFKIQMRSPETGFIHPNLEVNENLAYILGVIFGDGCVTKNKHRIFLNTTSETFAKSFGHALKKIGLHPCFYMVKLSGKNVKPRFYTIYQEINPKYKDAFYVVAASKAFYIWFKSLTLNNLQKLLMEMDCIKGFLRGFYESEGSISHKTKNAWQIVIYNTNIQLIKIVQEFLTRLGFSHSLRIIRPKNKRLKNEYSVYILGGTKEVMRFVREVNPCIKTGGATKCALS